MPLRQEVLGLQKTGAAHLSVKVIRFAGPRSESSNHHSESIVLKTFSEMGTDLDLLLSLSPFQPLRTTLDSKPATSGRNSPPKLPAIHCSTSRQILQIMQLEWIGKPTDPCYPWSLKLIAVLLTIQDPNRPNIFHSTRRKGCNRCQEPLTVHNVHLSSDSRKTWPNFWH